MVRIGLSPASEHKRGSGLDFAIAIALLAADGCVGQQAIDTCAFVGELGLDGSIRSCEGAITMEQIRVQLDVGMDKVKRLLKQVTAG